MPYSFGEVKSRVEFTVMFNSERAFPHTQRQLKGLGLNSCVALRKSLRLIGKKRFQFNGEHQDWTLEQWNKVMQCDKSGFTLFQGDGHIKDRREADAVMHPSYPRYFYIFREDISTYLVCSRDKLTINTRMQN